MNRPFKFRVWSKKDNKFLSINSDNCNLTYFGDIWYIKQYVGAKLWEIDTSKDGVILSNGDDNNNFIMQQFTGLLDKNNKMIYEGDILDFEGQIHGGYNYVKYQAQVKWKHGGYWLTSNHYFTNSINWIILGNIFENNDLLK